MDAYTLHLIESLDPFVQGLSWWWEKGQVGVDAEKRDGFVTDQHSGPTLADALAALLRDLGGEVPQRPSAEGVARIGREFIASDRDPDFLHDRMETDRLTLLAWLEGGEA